MKPETLQLLVTRTMPFGKYQGRLIADLPGNYLTWFAREGFPQGEIGRLLQLMHEIDHNGLKPLLPPLLLWVTCLGLVALDVGLALDSGVESSSFLLVNNVILAVVTVGAANLWAQSGMKAREVAVLAAVLTAYDAVATWHLTVMEDVFERLAQLPLVPVVAL